MMKKILLFALGLILSISSAFAEHPAIDTINVPNEFEMWIIRILIILVVAVVILTWLIIKKKLRIFNTLLIGIIIFIGVVFLGIFITQNKIRGCETYISVDWGSNYTIGRTTHILGSLFRFGKIDWNSVTNAEWENNNIQRDVTKLYKKDIDKLLGTDKWTVFSKKTRNMFAYDCIEWIIRFEDSGGKNQEVLINNAYNPDRLIVGVDMINSNKGNLDNMLGKGNWNIKDENFKINRRYKGSSCTLPDINYKEWIIEYKNYKNENKEIIIRSDENFIGQFQVHAKDILTEEAKSLLDLDCTVYLLPGNGPTISSEHIINKGYINGITNMDAIRGDEILDIKFNELSIINATKGNGINICIQNPIYEMKIETILEKLKISESEKMNVKFTFPVKDDSDKKDSFFSISEYKEISIVKEKEGIKDKYVSVRKIETRPQPVF